MKKLLTSTLALLALLMLYGCPLVTPHPLGEKGQYKIADEYIGTWEAEEDNKYASKVTISKKDDYNYDIEVLKTGNDYAADGKKLNGWLTKIDDITFLCIDNNGKGKDKAYFAYCPKKLDDNTFMLLDPFIDEETDPYAPTPKLRAELKEFISLYKQGTPTHGEKWIRK